MNATSHQSKSAGKVTMSNPKPLIIEGDKFNADHLITAWEKGLEDGGGLIGKQLHFAKIFNTASNVIKGFYHDHLEKQGCFSLFMKITVDQVFFIIAIPVELYFNDDKCRPLYKESDNITRSYPEISISFMPCSSNEEINRNSLRADYFVEIL